MTICVADYNRMSFSSTSRPRYRNSAINQKYEPTLLGTQGGLMIFLILISVRSRAATSAPLELETHPRLPSVTGLHKPQAASPLSSIQATT